MCPIDLFWNPEACISTTLHSLEGSISPAGSGLPSSSGFSERMGVSRHAKPISARKACGIWAVNWTWWCRTPGISAFTMSTHGVTVLRSCGILVSVVRWARTVRPCVRGLSKIAGAHLA